MICLARSLSFRDLREHDIQWMSGRARSPIFGSNNVSLIEQPPYYSWRSLKRGGFAMGQWLQEPRRLSAVQLQIGLLILGVLAVGAWLTYYTSTLPR